ncbi:MAG: hypothetical protein WC319_03850 [Candidatus Paceibacterota bacterium]|jgi:hypothetical protein
MAYGLVVQFHPKIQGELLEYVLEEIMKCHCAESDGDYYISSCKEESDLCSERYFDERHSTYSNCRMSFKRLKRFMKLNWDYWKDAVLYAEIQFIDKRTDLRYSYEIGVSLNSIYLK